MEQQLQYSALHHMWLPHLTPPLEVPVQLVPLDDADEGQAIHVALQHDAPAPEELALAGHAEEKTASPAPPPTTIRGSYAALDDTALHTHSVKWRRDEPDAADD
jgi:hypothetical protein